MKQTPVINPEWLTKKQAAAQLQVCTKTIERLIQSGKIEARNPTGGMVRISAASIEKFMS